MKARIVAVIFKALAISVITAYLWGIEDIRFWICMVAWAIGMGFDGSVNN